MAGLREIQGRIRSIEDTRKITGAMYMISSTKLKKAKKDLEKTEPYFYMLQSTIERIMRHLPEMEHPYFEDTSKEASRIGLLVITGDKGLAAQQFLDCAGKQVSLFVVGELGRQYFAGRKIPIAENFTYTVQDPTFDRARWICNILIEKYMTGEIEELHVIYTRMENSMLCQAEDKQLLPLSGKQLPAPPADVYQEEFKLEPSARDAVDMIVPNYLAGFIYGALVEAFCSEQNDRMLAMEAATDNADKLLHDLNILYNRARQAQITQEITEVSSGARAQRKKRNNKKKRAAMLQRRIEEVNV